MTTLFMNLAGVLGVAMGLIIPWGPFILGLVITLTRGRKVKKAWDYAFILIGGSLFSFLISVFILGKWLIDIGVMPFYGTWIGFIVCLFKCLSLKQDKNDGE